MAKVDPKDFQKKFIKDIFSNVQNDMLAKIEDGKVPADWEGPELRRWIIDKMEHTVKASKMSIKRLRNYLQNSLDNYL